MGRLFVYDENMTDERAKITVAKMAAVSDIVASEKAFIQYSAAGQLTVLAGAVIAVGDAIFRPKKQRFPPPTWTVQAALHTAKIITFTYATMARTVQTRFI